MANYVAPPQDDFTFYAAPPEEPKKDKYKVDKTQPPKVIQLSDASGPPIHDLSDERNYKFLQELFDKGKLIASHHKLIPESSLKKFPEKG